MQSNVHHRIPYEHRNRLGGNTHNERIIHHNFQLLQKRRPGSKPLIEHSAFGGLTDIFSSASKVLRETTGLTKLVSAASESAGDLAGLTGKAASEAAELGGLGGKIASNTAGDLAGLSGKVAGEASEFAGLGGKAAGEVADITQAGTKGTANVLELQADLAKSTAKVEATLGDGIADVAKKTGASTTDVLETGQKQLDEIPTKKMAEAKTNLEETKLPGDKPAAKGDAWLNTTPLGLAGATIAAIFVGQAIKKHMDTDNVSTNITSIVTDEASGKTKVTFTPGVDLNTQCTVDISGSNCSPSIDGADQSILSVYSKSSIIIDRVITVPGSRGNILTHSSFEGALSDTISDGASLVGSSVGGVAGSTLKGAVSGISSGASAMSDALGLTSFFKEWKWGLFICCGSIVLVILIVIVKTVLGKFL